MTDKTKFYILAFILVAMISVMFIPTGKDGEWVFIDYFHVLFSVPVAAYWFWRFYKKV